MILARAVHFLVLFVITTATTEFSSAAGSEVTVVNTTRGVIRGHVLKSYNENDYYAFQGIPYAAPSVGKNRLKEPREHDPWDGVLNTTENTKICMQPHYGDPFYESMERTEDCLLLNVFTPTKPGSKDLLPVLIWIHGGTFVGESATYFGPKFLMDYDIVIVTINYRIGAFGFLGTDDGVIPLNLGLKDQRFAMKWVNKNIHLFGGNPKQVTLAGQSAGSISVGYHLLGEWKDEEELFHRAIFHSGNTISGICTQQNATNNAFNNAKYLDSSFSSNDTHELLALFQNADAQDILTKCFVNGVVQEENGPFSYQGYQSFLNGNYKKIPVMIGFTSEEEVNTITVNNTDNDTLEAFDKDPSLLISHDVNMSPENKQIAGKLFKDVYTNSSFVDHMGGYVRWWSDRYFTTGVCKQVELASIHSSYYFYQFSYKGELGHFMNTIIPEGAERVGHVEDMMYLWDAGWNTNLDEYPKEDQLMAQRFRKLWTNFIKYGNPTPEQDVLLNNIYWQTSEPQSLRYLNINSTLKMLEHPRQYQRIKEILERYMEPPFNVFS